MTRRALVGILGFVLAALAVWWLLFVLAPRFYRTDDPAQGQAATTPVAGPETAQRKITATVYVIADDGMSMLPVQREVAFGDPIVEQARHIIEAQIAPVQPPVATAIPPGTKLRAVFLGDRGDAFVDLSSEITSNHPGGALEELFTVYTIVNALTVNLPAITRVQILIDGKEADTLAGHVDLRQPLSKNLTWVKTDNPS